jgi:hypothetical protein
MLITYSDYNPASQESIPAFGVYSISPETIGVEIQPEEFFEGANGRSLDSVMLANSKILVAWTNTANNQIQGGILSDNGTLVTFDNQLIPFPNPDFRQGYFVSVTATTDGDGILSWFDAEGGNRLYYAMVNSNGDVITPPIFSWVDTETITVSRTGQGIAPIPDWRLFAPLIKKK